MRNKGVYRMGSSSIQSLNARPEGQPNQGVNNSMKVSPILAIILTLITLSLPACHEQKEQSHQEYHQIVLTSPKAKDVTITQQYVCQIHSRNHINVRALQSGYLEEILVKEG